MNLKELSDLTDEELQKEAKSGATAKIFDALIIGVLMGIAVYSSVRNGLGLLTFLPLIYIPSTVKHNKKRAEMEKLMAERGLK